MSDAAIPTEQSAELHPPAASAPAALAPDGDADTEDTRTARQRILDHFDDTAEAGDQTVAQILEGTTLSRQVVDPLLSRMTKAGVLLRVSQGLYRLAPPAPKPDLPPTPAEQPRADGISLAQWVAWLHVWDRGEPWAGPGVPPDRETGIMVAGGGCRVPLNGWAVFRGERDALAKLRAADATMRDRLIAAAHGNVARNAKLDDLRAVHIMIASGIEVELIEMAVRHRHDRRIQPSNPPLASWPDVMGKVAELYARSVLARKLVDRWQARLADPNASTDDSPTLRRTVSEIVPRNAVDSHRDRGLGQRHSHVRTR